MAQFSAGQTFGRWTLKDFINEGGNGEVWCAENADGESAAIKILRTRRVDSEPYARFQQEIAALQRVGRRRGVLPVLDYELPEKPQRQRAWFAMPVAKPLAEELRDRPLRDVVSAIAIIADVLAALKRELGLHHRDIKPNNLYMWNDEPALSDFGLVDIPDGLDLTASGRPLGPANFLPYEMLTRASQADPGPADVYCLAKTLWVLCTDQRWPPPGEQSSANPALSVSEYRPHRLAGQLDALIERCTKHAPEERPTMEHVASDLRAWLELDDRTPLRSVDTSSVWKRVREAAAPRFTEAQKEADERDCVRASARALQELLEPLHSEIRENFSAAEFNVRPDGLEGYFSYGLIRDTRQDDLRATIIPGPGWNPIRLIIGLAVAIKDDGRLHHQGMYYLGRTETMGGTVDHWESEPAAADCGSLELEASLARLADDMVGAFPEWLVKLDEALEGGPRATMSNI